MSDDYGYFGKGTEGYIHYMQSFNENFGNGKGGGGKRPPKSGCLTQIIGIISIVVIILVILIFG